MLADESFEPIADFLAYLFDTLQMLIAIRFLVLLVGNLAFDGGLWNFSGWSSGIGFYLLLFIYRLVISLIEWTSRRHFLDLLHSLLQNLRFLEIWASVIRYQSALLGG